MSVNKCIFIGNMGRDAEVRTTETGIKVAQFSIACTERAYTNKAGQTIPGENRMDTRRSLEGIGGNH